MPKLASCWAKYWELVLTISPSNSSVPTQIISAFVRLGTRKIGIRLYPMFEEKITLNNP